MPPSDGTLQNLARCINAVAAGQPIAPISMPTDADKEIAAAVDAVNRLIANFKELRELSTALANGSIDVKVAPHLHLLDPLKSLQASLRHLTWQTQQVAAGDLDQHVDFLGEFSIAFNKMVEALREKQRAERLAAAEHLDFLAHHDALTELPNRLLVIDRLSQAIVSAGHSRAKVALMLLDLDNFKSINDTLGHSVGDELLKAVAERLGTCVRDMDTLARVGGDEFLIMAPDLRDSGAITAISEEILEALAKPFSIAGQELGTSASIGIAAYPEDGDNFEAMFSAADTAMYQAKQAGRNTYRFFDPRMNEGMDERLQLRNDLTHALERGELQVYYQPQINIVSGTITGAEALIRWNHPRLGMISPARFIPIAEDSGAIVEIGAWVLSEACRQVVEWRGAGLSELVIAVNLSAVQFRRGDVERSVLSTLTASGLSPRYLELELTESMLVDDPESVLQIMRRLKALGVGLSIDDFGTGYSSLAYLKRFPVDKVKIDQAFVREVDRVANDAAIVKAIVQMAQGLGLKTIAEGVENERQLDHLRHCGCESVQGFYFGRPMPSDQFERYCRDAQGGQPLGRALGA